MKNSCPLKCGSPHSKAVAFFQGCCVLGKMQNLKHQDFLGATETHGSAAQSSLETVQEGRNSARSTWVVFWFGFGFFFC